MEVLTLIELLVLPILSVAVCSAVFKTDWMYGLAMLGVCLLAFWGFYALFSASKTWDSEVWNGAVVSKSREEVSCRHSYECNCYYTRDSKGNSTRHCSTCYEHSYDVDWDVQSNIGGYSIETVDRQGLVQPARWTSVEPGDPVSRVKSFTNYIRGAQFSVFHNDAIEVAKRWKDKLPGYPDTVYDYWHIDRVIPVGFNLPDIKTWNWRLENALKTLGPAKQANVVIVMTKTLDTSFADALNTSWIGGKKNDAVVVIGAPEYPKIGWVKVLSWTTNNMFKVELRDRLLDSGTLSSDKTVGIIAEEVQKQFVRMHMKSFKYLEADIGPSTGALIFLWILSIMTAAGFAWFSFANPNTQSDFSY